LTTPAIAASEVAVSRNGHSLLQGVSFAASPGEVIGIVGPNGAGKSTLLRVLAGDIRPSRGDALLLGRPAAAQTLRQLALIRAFVGPQTASEVVFVVREVVAMGRYPYGDEDSDVASKIVDEALVRLDVDGLADRELRTLSSGEQQRVLIARAVVQDTGILLLDEPTSALDLRHQELVMELLRELASDAKSVVAALHDLNLAAAYADRILLMAGGEVQAFGTPEEVLTGQRLSAAYERSVEVMRHPFRDCPLVLTSG
jgi:iron complex transport system ATP-binding protein